MHYCARRLPWCHRLSRFDWSILLDAFHLIHFIAFFVHSALLSLIVWPRSRGGLTFAYQQLCFLIIPFCRLSAGGQWDDAVLMRLKRRNGHHSLTCKAYDGQKRVGTTNTYRRIVNGYSLPPVCDTTCSRNAVSTRLNLVMEKTQ